MVMLGMCEQKERSNAPWWVAPSSPTMPAWLHKNTTGSFCGQMLAGVLTTLLPARIVLSGFMALNAISALFIIGGNRKHVKAIYNHDQ